MSRRLLVVIGAFFVFAYLYYVAHTPVADRSTAPFSAAGRIVVTFLEAAPIFWWAWRRAAQFRWLHSLVALMIAVAELMVVSLIYGSNLDVTLLVALWAWSSVFLSCILAGALSRLWVAALVGAVLPPAVMVTDLVMGQLRVYGVINVA